MLKKNPDGYIVCAARANLIIYHCYYYTIITLTHSWGLCLRYIHSDSQLHPRIRRWMAVECTATRFLSVHCSHLPTKTDSQDRLASFFFSSGCGASYLTLGARLSALYSYM